MEVVPKNVALQVAVPLPKPALPLQQLDEYKIQFAFDGKQKG